MLLQICLLARDALHELRQSSRLLLLLGLIRGLLPSQLGLPLLFLPFREFQVPSVLAALSGQTTPLQLLSELQGLSDLLALLAALFFAGGLVLWDPVLRGGLNRTRLCYGRAQGFSHVVELELGERVDQCGLLG